MNRIRPRKFKTRVKKAMGLSVPLTSHGAHGHIWGISIQYTWQVWMRISQSESVQHSLFQPEKRALCFIRPLKRGFFLCQSGQRISYRRNVLDKPAVITREPIERSRVPRTVRCGPVPNCVELGRLVRSKPSAESRWPRNSIGDINRTHLDGLAFSPCWRKREKTESNRSLSIDYYIVQIAETLDV